VVPTPTVLPGSFMLFAWTILVELRVEPPFAMDSAEAN
jgi:hypothetical protein